MVGDDMRRGIRDGQKKRVKIYKNQCCVRGLVGC